MRRRLAVLCAAVLALALAGCGDDDKSKDSSGSDGSGGADQYEQKAGEICTAANEKLAQVKKDAEGEPGSAEFIAGNIEAINGVFRDTKAKLSELTPPADKKAAFERYLATYDQSGELFDELLSAARSQDEAAVEAVNKRLGQLASESNESANAAGLSDQCGVSGGPGG